MSQEIRDIIANNVKKLRTKKRLKREELSLILGFDNSYISKLEKCKINISIDTLEKIANKLNIQIIDLLR